MTDKSIFFSPENPPLSGILSIVALAPWAYIGFASIPQAAEEFKFSPKKAFRLMIISLFVGSLVYIAVNIITAVVFPWTDFISSGPYWATGAAVEELMGQESLFSCYR